MVSVTEMHLFVGRPQTLAGLLLGALFCGGLPDAGAARLSDAMPRDERIEFRRILADMGYYETVDGRTLFRKPYSRPLCVRVLAKIGQLQLVPEGRDSYVIVLIQAIQAGWMPAEDIEKLVRPAVAQAVEALKRQPNQEDMLALLTADAERCLWNVDYALAVAERGSSIKKEDNEALSAAMKKLDGLDNVAKQRMRSTRTDYLGDLIAWCEHFDIDAETKRMQDLVNAEPRSPRVQAAVLRLQARKGLTECKSDNQRAKILRATAEREGLPMTVRAWAVLELGRFPTKAVEELLWQLFQTKRAGDADYDLGFAAQEALKELKKIPEDVHKFARE